MASRLRILSSGVCCSIQDSGRVGYLRRGVSSSGPMDWLSFALAVKLAGMPPGGPAIEVSVGGMEIEVLDNDIHLGLAGGAFTVSVDGEPVAHPACLRLRPFQRVSIKTGPSGSWLYVAPSAAIDVEPILGSYSTHARYSIGPAGGKILQPGDELRLREPAVVPTVYATQLPHLASTFPIRVVLGPQDHLFDEENIGQFLASRFVLTERRDRMAYVFEGPRIFASTSMGIVTDATALGSIQIAGDGSPYVLMADRSSTGGYPKIGTVIRADVGRLAQKRPGEAVQFKAVNIAAAVSLLRELKNEIDLVGSGTRKGWIDLEALLLGAGNSGVCDAHQADI